MHDHKIALNILDNYKCSIPVSGILLMKENEIINKYIAFDYLLFYKTFFCFFDLKV